MCCWVWARDLGQKVSIGAARETLGLAVPEEAPRAIINQAQDLVGFAFTGSLDERLLPFRRPGVAQGTPLGEPGFIAKENHGALLLRQAHNRWPGLLFPLGPCGFIQVIRDKTCLLKRKIQLVQQRTDVMRMIFHAKGAQDQVLDQDGTPTPRRVARCFWSGFDQGCQLLSLRLRQLGRAAWWFLIGQRHHTAVQERVHIITYGLRTQVQQGSNFVNRLAFDDEQQGMNPPDQAHLPDLVCTLQALVDSLTQRPIQTYPDVHERCLLSHGFSHPIGSHLSVLSSTPYPPKPATITNLFLIVYRIAPGASRPAWLPVRFLFARPRRSSVRAPNASCYQRNFAPGTHWD